VSDYLKQFFRFAVFILVQVYVLNKIPHLHRLIVPYLYYLPLLWLPFSVSRIWLLITGFTCRCLRTGGVCQAICDQVPYTKGRFGT